MNKQKTSTKIEQFFESILWRTRWIILIAVIFSILASFSLFVFGSYEIWHTVKHIWVTGFNDPDYTGLLIGIIGAIDFYLIGIVLLIFAFGIYELFISKIDIARGNDEEHNILEITSLDELKNKLLKVIVMVLIVFFFKTVLGATFNGALEKMYFAFSILAIAICYYVINLTDHKK